MCGIVGIISLNQEETFQAKYIHEMANKIKHRGPNDEGYVVFHKYGNTSFFGNDTYQSENDNLNVANNYIKNAYEIKSHIAFGHRRLSIMDLSFAGHQPMEYLNRYWIVYNGEIYNYIEIREELRKLGYSFNSNSDTEVIMAAYDRWGLKCLERFNGMWAFVIYDTYVRKLFMSRDRFGIKPLYYYKDDNNFVFASEIKAILEHPDVKTAPNIWYCKEYLSEGPKEYIKETAFQNIFHFFHASYFEIDIENLKKNDINEKKFWDCRPNLNSERFDKKEADVYARKYYELLSDAVRIRLRADVKVGAALSGGLDSSTIVYMINQHLRKQGLTERLETFSSVYKSSNSVKYCDESVYIDELSKFLNVKSNQIEPEIDEIIHEYKKMIHAMENPAVGPNMGGWYTFKLVGSSDVTINLDGQGADEQLGGYFTYLWRHFTNLPLSEILNEFMAFSWIPGVSKTKMLVSILLNLLRRVLPVRVANKIFNKIGNKYGTSILEPVNKALYASTMSALINLIHFGDSQSMAHSIESRLPFMDYRLVEFIASIPSVYKIHGGWTKYIARLAMDNKLPDNITWRKDKMGWPDPSEYWFRGTLKEWLCTEVESSLFLKNLLCGECNIRKRIDTKEPIINLIRLLNLKIWHDIFFNKISSESVVQL